MDLYRVFIRTGRGPTDEKREVCFTVRALSRESAGRLAVMEAVALGESATLVDVVNVMPDVEVVLDHTWLWAE